MGWTSGSLVDAVHVPTAHVLGATVVKVADVVGPDRAQSTAQGLPSR